MSRFVTICLILIPGMRFQLHERVEPRAPQVYYEDSAHVFFKDGPNPFCPPTVRDTGKGLICGGGRFYQFYCDLSGRVTVAFINAQDSIIYSANVRSTNLPHFTFCFWLAGPGVRKELLPAKYFRSDVDVKIRELIIVRGRKKCKMDLDFFVQKGYYYWIDDRVR